jgi:hypothetical protein
MYTSSGPEGACVEIELPALNPSGGGRAFYSDCSEAGDSAVNPATIVDDRGGLVYGVAPDGTARVELDLMGAADRAATVRAAPNGSHRGFAAAIEDADSSGMVRAVRANGAEISARAIP